MSVGRFLVRASLVVAFVLAVAIVAVALGRTGDNATPAWSAIAAALAVIAAVVSAFAAQRVIELEEDRQRPHLEVFLDMRSRYGLTQLAIHNSGGGAAGGPTLTIGFLGPPLGRSPPGTGA